MKIHSHLQQQLNHLFFDVRQECPDINKGGCGIFAYHVGKHLVNLGYDVRLITLSDYYDDKDISMINEHNWRNVHSLYTFQHIALEHDGIYFDCFGWTTYVRKIGNDNYKYKLKGYLSFDVLEKMISHSGMWNNTFDRKNISTITQKINSFFNELYYQQNTCPKKWRN